MSQIWDFEREFVQRTKQILLDYKGPNDMSIILNSTLSLIILPNELINPTDAEWDRELKNILDLPAFRLGHFEPIKKIKRNKIDYYPKTLKILLKKIRNGLAHQHVDPINRDGNSLCANMV